MRSSGEFPAIDTPAWVWNFDVVEGLFEVVSSAAILFVLVYRRQPFRERVLVDVILVVLNRVWVARVTLIRLTCSICKRRWVCLIVLDQGVVRLAKVFKILEFLLELHRRGL